MLNIVDSSAGGVVVEGSCDNAIGVEELVLGLAPINVEEVEGHLLIDETMSLKSRALRFVTDPVTLTH